MAVHTHHSHGDTGNDAVDHHDHGELGSSSTNDGREVGSTQAQQIPIPTRENLDASGRDVGDRNNDNRLAVPGGGGSEEDDDDDEDPYNRIIRSPKMSTAGIAMGSHHHHAASSSSHHRNRRGGHGGTQSSATRTRSTASGSAAPTKGVRARDHARTGAPRIPHYGSTTTSLSASTSPVGGVADDTDTDSGSVTTGGGQATTFGEKVAVGGYGYRWLYNTGDEPGVDVRKAPGVYAKLKDPARCTIVDYDERGRGTRVDVPGAKLRDWLESEDGKRPTDVEEEEEQGNREEAARSGGGGGGGEGTATPQRQYSTGSPHPQHPGRSRTRSVRWINVDGINFDIVKTLALRYDLHPLAIEDALRAGNNPRSKVDFYASHLYAQVFVQYQHDGDEEEIQREAAAINSASGLHLRRQHQTDITAVKGKSGGGSDGGWRKWLGLDHGPMLQSLPEGVEGVFEPIQTVQTRRGRMIKADPHRMVIDHLSAKYMIPLRRSVLSIFMLRDGTLITMSASPCAGVLDPIYLRLDQEDGLLRRTCDASMLLEALLDVVVDIAIETCKTFETEILKIEAGCLVNPEMETVRHLHIISSQLIRLKRTLAPLSKVLYTLRDQDTQRALASMFYAARPPMAAAASPLAGGGPHLGAVGTAGGGGTMTPIHGAPGIPPTPSPSYPPPTGGVDLALAPGGSSSGYVSSTTKVYLSDVIDHLDTVLASFDQYIATCEHLTDYIFNMLSFITNASMERLSLVTVIFLPLTFMAGYYGMNFTSFPALDNPDAYFWVVSGPLVVGFFVIFCWSYILNGFKVLGRIVWRRRHSEQQQQQQQQEKANMMRRRRMSRRG